MSKEGIIPYGSVLPCGGRGTRLQPITEDRIPKSLFKVGGQELIRYSTDVLDPSMVGHLVFAVDHRAEQIHDWVESAGLPNIVRFSEQTEPGVLGALSTAAVQVPEAQFIACNTDEVRTNMDLERILDFHEKSGTLATMVTTYTNRLSRHRTVTVRGDGRVVATELKPESYKNKPHAVGLVNTGFLVMDKRVTEHFDPSHSIDWGGLIDPLCDAGQLSAFADRNIAYFNVGTPEEYQEAETFLRQKAA